MLLMLSGGVTSLGGAVTYDVLEHHTSSPPPIVLSLPADAQQCVVTPDAASPNHFVVSCPKKPAHDHDCPPAMREELERLDVWSNLRDLHRDLGEVQKNLVQRELARETVDKAQDDLLDLLKKLAGCGDDSSPSL
jgi:hypothetical protein